MINLYTDYAPGLRDFSLLLNNQRVKIIRDAVPKIVPVIKVKSYFQYFCLPSSA